MVVRKAPNTYSPNITIPGNGVQGGNAAFGQAVVVIQYTDNTTATINSGVQMYAASLNVHAQTAVFNVSGLLSGASSGNFGYNGVVSVVVVNNTTLAQVANGAQITVGSAGAVETVPQTYPWLGATLPTVTGWGVQQTQLPGTITTNPDNSLTDTLNASTIVQAHDYTGLWNIAGGWLAGQNTGAGASVDVTVVNRNTQAVIGDLASTSGQFAGAPTIISEGPVAVDAKNYGYVVSVAIGGAIQGIPSSSQPQNAPNGGGSYGFGISGAVAVNTINDTTLAYIHDTYVSTNSATAGVSVTASNTTNIVSVTGAASLLLPSGSSGGSAGVAGSWSQNSLGGSTQAYVDSTVVSLGLGTLTISATSTESVISVSASGSVTISQQGLNIAGQVSINNDSASTAADIVDNSSVQDGGTTVTATDGDSILALAGAVAFGGGPGFGASVSLNNITNNGSLASAYINNSSVNATGPVQVAANGAEGIMAITAALAGSLSSMAGAVSVSINTIGSAGILASIALSSYINTTGSITVSAADTSTIWALAGGLAGTGGSAAFGISWATNNIKKSVQATINSSNVTTTSTLSVNATSTASITALTVGGSGAASYALGGSISLNTITSTITASIAANSNVQAAGVAVFLSDTPTINAYGGGGAGAGTGTFGAGIATNNIADIDSAVIDNSNVTSTSTLTLTATSTSMIQSITLGGSFAGSYAGGGAVSLNNIGNSLTADIANGAIVSATGAISLTAADTPTINAKAGGIAGAGTAAVGGALATNTITDQAAAYVNNATLSSTSGSITISAISTSNMQTLTVGGSIAGTAAVTGSVSLNTIRDKINAYVAGGAKVSASGTLGITATDTPSISALAGGVALAGTASIGAAVATNDIADVTSAYVDGATATSSAGAISVSASSTASLSTITVGGSVAGTVAASGSVSLNKIANQTTAYVADGATVKCRGAQCNCHR